MSEEVNQPENFDQDYIYILVHLATSSVKILGNILLLVECIGSIRPTSDMFRRTEEVYRLRKRLNVHRVPHSCHLPREAQ